LCGSHMSFIGSTVGASPVRTNEATMSNMLYTRAPQGTEGERKICKLAEICRARESGHFGPSPGYGVVHRSPTGIGGVLLTTDLREGGLPSHYRPHTFFLYPPRTVSRLIA
jgi:hypothetical protein